MTNKKNKPNNLLAITFTSAFLLFAGLTYSPEASSEKPSILYPLFGNFYPEESTNFVSIPNLRKGSGIR